VKSVARIRGVKLGVVVIKIGEGRWLEIVSVNGPEFAMARVEVGKGAAILGRVGKGFALDGGQADKWTGREHSPL